MLIDTHCHLDAAEFAADLPQVRRRAWDAGVRIVVVPAVSAGNFAAVRDLAHGPGDRPVLGYALGIHPLFVPQARDEDLADLELFLRRAVDDERLLAIGEIGLDFFVPEVSGAAMRARQEWFCERQFELARRFDLPVLLHARRSHDRLLKYLRRHAPPGGVAHAFNGSRQQAEQFVALGFALGVGGAMTYERARRIRRLVCDMPLDTLVLETDAPDMPPAWLGRGASGERVRNEPAELAGVARALATLRQMPMPELVEQCTRNALRVLPRLASLVKLAGVRVFPL